MASTVHRWASQVAQGERIHLPMQMPQETWVQSLGREDPLEDEMETHFHILAWIIPWIFVKLSETMLTLYRHSDF